MGLSPYTATVRREPAVAGRSVQGKGRGAAVPCGDMGFGGGECETALRVYGEVRKTVPVLNTTSWFDTRDSHERFFESAPRMEEGNGNGLRATYCSTDVERVS